MHQLILRERNQRNHILRWSGVVFAGHYGTFLLLGIARVHKNDCEQTHLISSYPAIQEANLWYIQPNHGNRYNSWSENYGYSRWQPWQDKPLSCFCSIPRGLFQSAACRRRTWWLTAWPKWDAKNVDFDSQKATIIRCVDMTYQDYEMIQETLEKVHWNCCGWGLCSLRREGDRC